MNRKLHNSLIAAMASTLLLIAGLLVATPIQPALQMQGSAAVTTADAAAPDDTTGQDTESSPSPAAQSSRPRQSVRMPFFSFAARS